MTLRQRTEERAWLRYGLTPLRMMNSMMGVAAAACTRIYCVPVVGKHSVLLARVARKTSAASTEATEPSFVSKSVAYVTRKAEEVWDGIRTAPDGTYKARVYHYADRFILQRIRVEETLFSALATANLDNVQVRYCCCCCCCCSSYLSTFARSLAHSLTHSCAWLYLDHPSGTNGCRGREGQAKARCANGSREASLLARRLVRRAAGDAGAVHSAAAAKLLVVLECVAHLLAQPRHERRQALEPHRT